MKKEFIRCLALKKDGTRCKRPEKRGQMFCPYHTDIPPARTFKVRTKPRTNKHRFGNEVSTVDTDFRSMRSW